MGNYPLRDHEFKILLRERKQYKVTLKVLQTIEIKVYCLIQKQRGY